jgi:hypothetical protein
MSLGALEVSEQERIAVTIMVAVIPVPSAFKMPENPVVRVIRNSRVEGYI